jgi:hypothetical protein
MICCGNVALFLSKYEISVSFLNVLGVYVEKIMNFSQKLFVVAKKHYLCL